MFSINNFHNQKRNKYIQPIFDLFLIGFLKLLILLFLNLFLERGDQSVSSIAQFIYIIKWTSLLSVIIYLFFRIGGVNSPYFFLKEKIHNLYFELKFIDFKLVHKDWKLNFVWLIYLFSLFIVVYRIYSHGVITTNTFPLSDDPYNLGFPSNRNIFLVLILFSFFNFISYKLSQSLTRKYFFRFSIYSFLTLSPIALTVLLSNPWKDFMSRWLVLASILLLFILEIRSTSFNFKYGIPIFFLIGLSYPFRKEVIILSFILIIISIIAYGNWRKYFNRKFFIYPAFFAIGFCPAGVCGDTYSSCIHSSAMGTLTNLDILNLSHYISSVSPSLNDLEIYKVCKFLGFDDSILGGYIPNLLGVLKFEDYFSLLFNGIDYVLSLPSLSLILFITLLFGKYVSLISPVLFVLYFLFKIITAILLLNLILKFRFLIPQNKMPVAFSIGFITLMTVLRPIQALDKHSSYILIPIIYLLVVSSKEVFKNLKPNLS